jgi:hypothetical protein
MTVAWFAEVPRLAGSLGADYDKSNLYTPVFVLRENPTDQDQSLWELMPLK